MLPGISGPRVISWSRLRPPRWVGEDFPRSFSPPRLARGGFLPDLVSRLALEIARFLICRDRRGIAIVWDRLGGPGGLCLSVCSYVHT